MVFLNLVYISVSSDQLLTMLQLLKIISIDAYKISKVPKALSLWYSIYSHELTIIRKPTAGFLQSLRSFLQKSNDLHWAALKALRMSRTEYRTQRRILCSVTLHVSATPQAPSLLITKMKWWCPAMAYFTDACEALWDPQIEDTMTMQSNWVKEELGRASKPPWKGEHFVLRSFQWLGKIF